jgi:2-oxoglutarate dehydrogenase E1 component
MMNQLFGNSLLFGGNAPFVEELYENYLDNPGSVSEQWRDYFDKLAQLPGYVARDVPHLPVINAFAEQARKGGYRAAAAAPVDDRKQVGVLQMITSYRFIGDRWANLDPLKRMVRPEVPQLDPAYYGFSDADLHTVFNAGSFKGTPDHATFGQIYDALKATYCGSIGVEYMYISTVAEKRWIQDRLERIHSKPNYTADERRRMLERLTAAETLERYLHTRYVGQKRFSLEGGESAIVAMDELIRVAGAGGGIDEIVVGMAHRGRLNVLVNTLGKAPAMLFEEFEGKKAQVLTAGDVKYHMGYSSDVSTPGGPCHLTLAFNPSHLEIVNPVVVGSVYSRQRRRGANGRDKVLAVLLHGDAAVAGQGVNQEMLNFAQTRGYGVGGTIHVVINNQIGFTTSDPRDSSFVAVLHRHLQDGRGADLPRQWRRPRGRGAGHRHRRASTGKTFKKDVVIDIVCYPQARTQRAGRADGHAAVDVQEDPATSRNAQALRRQARRRGRSGSGRVRTR